MKKQMRIFIFAALLVLLLGVTVLAVSAADEYVRYGNATDAANNENPLGTYSTLNAAVTDVSANNQVIKLTADVTDSTAVSFNKNYTYTVDGNDCTITNTATATAWTISTGTVTIQNLTFTRSNTSGDLISVSSSGSVTLDSVALEGGNRYMINQSSGTVTFRGSCSFTGAGLSYGTMIHCGNSSKNGKVVFNCDSTITVPSGKILFGGSGAKLHVKSGSYTTDTGTFFKAWDNSYCSSMLIEDGTFTVTGDGNVVWYYSYGQITSTNRLDVGDSNVIVDIKGGTFDISGTGRGICTAFATTRVSKADGVIDTSKSPVIRISDPESKTVFRSTSGGSKVRFVYDNSTLPKATAAKILIEGGSFTGGSSGETRMLMFENGNGTIEVTGGTFSNNSRAANSLLYSDWTSVKSATQGTFNIKGGTWTGSTGYWFAGNGNAVVNLGDPENPASTYPRFSGSCSSTPIGLWNKHAGWQKEASGQLNIYSGTYTYTAEGTAPMIWGAGGAVTISGGTFSSASSYIFYACDRDIMSPLYITGGDFTVTKEGAQIISYEYHNKDAADGAYAGKDVCGQVRATSWTYGNVILKIDGGNFHVNAASGNAVFTCFNVCAIQAVEAKDTIFTAYNGSNQPIAAGIGADGKPCAADGEHPLTSLYPDGVLDPDDTIYVEITGGTFTTSTNTINAFIHDGRSDKGRYTSAENGVNPTLSVHYTISGTASFTGGRCWVRVHDNAVVNIEGGTFHSGASFDGDTRYLWLHNPSVAGAELNISGGTFTEITGKRMFNAAGGTVNISAGSFTALANMITMADGDMVSNVTITGGTFHSTGTNSTILFNAGDSAQNWHEGTLRITGGTFTVDNASTKSLEYTTAQTHTNYCYIESGTFGGKIQSTNTAHPLLITSGTFNNTIEETGVAILITGGRFTAGSGFEACVPGRGLVGVTDDSTYKRVTAANLHGFVGTQMRLGTDLGVYFYVLTIDAVDSGTPSLIVSFDESTLATLTEYTTPANYPDGTAVESGYTLYCFTFNGLPPQRMGDDLDVVFKLTGVSKFANEFSGLRYCRQVREAYPTAEMLAVTGALLNFGAAAQTYSGYHTSSLVNATAADITGATAFSAVSEKLASYGGTLGTPHFVKTEENGVAARGVRFDTGIQLYARVIDTTGAVTCTYSVAGGAPVACEKVDLGSNRYAFYTGAITLDHFEDNVVFTLSTGETCTYSVQAFVYYYQDHATDDNGKALARALWAYKTAVVGTSLNDWVGFDVADVVNP